MPYPPGMSKRDFVRAGIDNPHEHDHEWYPGDMSNPLLEDGAAIFHERCRYAEGRWGEGWECEETRTFRCDVERVVKLRDGKPDVAYLASEENHHEEWGHIESVFEEALVAAERAERNGDLDVLDIDPPNDYGDGYVRVRANGYEVIYKQ